MLRVTEKEMEVPMMLFGPMMSWRQSSGGFGLFGWMGEMMRAMWQWMFGWMR